MNEETNVETKKKVIVFDIYTRHVSVYFSFRLTPINQHSVVLVNDYILDVTVVVFNTLYILVDFMMMMMMMVFGTKKSSHSPRNKTKQNHYQPHTVCVCVCVEHTHKLTQMEINYNPKNKQTNTQMCLFVCL